jgi:hypothetical protein
MTAFTIVWKGVTRGEAFKAYQDLPIDAEWFDTHLVNNEGT